MFRGTVQWLHKFARDSNGETQAEFAALSAGASATIYLVLKTLLRTLA